MKVIKKIWNEFKGMSTYEDEMTISASKSGQIQHSTRNEV